jgi:endoglucanase
MFAEIAQAEFKTVRIPVNFGAWANYEKPFHWTQPENLKFVDSFVRWALNNNLNAIIDLHHVEFDGKVAGAATTERITWLWQEIAARYKNTDPEWRAQAEAIIKAIRPIVPSHTLIVGFHDWNSRTALIESKPFADANIIYTFHYYHPFLFTHQGATWSSEGLAESKNIPFPANKETKLTVPETAKGKWTESLFIKYPVEANAEQIFKELKEAKDWSVKNKVPIFVGEFGSYGKYAAPADRCRHAEAVYTALGKLNIPNAWWEWDQGFNMFEPGTTKISDCMRKAVDSFSSKR